MPKPDLPSSIIDEEIFRATAALPTAERAAYLEAACEGQPEVRARIDRMLEVQGIGALLQQPMDEPVPPEIEAELARLKPEEGGERIGNYKLLQQIGEGGFGTVWMAEQIEPVRRRVALKIIKLGMDTKEVIARFEQERQALALMDHPNIAKVFDAGATQYGRPFFVMELVRGIRITEYCDQNNLPTAERLGLFIAVCNAVQHAHQKGVIHRDLKPSNILVTLHDGLPVPKVIDFGVAKATQSQRLTDLTLFTQFEQMIGTPLYMSPEQAEMSGLDIDTRSDIYSLGVLLYELLAGRTPFDPEELMRKGHDEIRRAIREQEPPKPSTALHTMAVETRTIIAQHRQADGAKLIGLIRGDLDWIVMKALEKDRTRRYETANGLALDIKRHLDNEPVLARPATRLYRVRRLVRRNKLAFAAIISIAAVLVAGVVVSTWQAVRATVAEKRATEKTADEKVAREDAEAVAKFLSEVFQSPDPTRDGRNITVAETLGRAVQKLETDLASQPARRARLQVTLGTTYHSLGLEREAIPLLEKARDYRLATLGLEHRDTLNAIHNLAISYQDGGRRDEAIKLQEEVLPLYRKVLGPEHLETLRAMHNLAFSYGVADRRLDALKLQEEVLAISRKVNGPEDLLTLAAMGNLADLFGAAGRLADALKLREEVLALRRKVNGPEHPHTLGAMHNLATSYEDGGRRDDALKLREDVLPLYEKVNGPEHPDTLRAMHNLAYTRRAVGRRNDALKLQQEALALFRKVLGPEDPYTLGAMGNLAELFSDVGRKDDALKLREEVLALRRKVLGPEHGHTLFAMSDLASSYHDAHRRDDALKLREEVLALNHKVNGPEHPGTLTATSDLARSYADAGRRDEALTMLEQVLALRRKVLGNEHEEVAASLGKLGEFARERGDLPAAEAHLLEGWKLAGSARADLQRDLLDNLVQLYVAWSKTDATKSAAVAEWKQKLADFDQAHPDMKSKQP